MKNIRKIHGRAMELMRIAKQDLENRDMVSYLRNTQVAFELEHEAAYALLSNFESEPTRSVLFRSAANLAYNLGQLEEAEKLIYQALSGNPHHEIKAELLSLKDSIDVAYGREFSRADITEYNYINIVKEHAVNLKIEPKTERYSKAVVLDSIIDFLKNIQSSYKNFSEVLFRKNFNEIDYQDYETTITKFKKDSNLLMVNLKFESFGVGLVADTTIMNYKFDTSSKFTDFKATLFDEYKKDVLFADLNSEDFQLKIGEKFDESERLKIYSSLANSLDSKSDYKISISDEDFKFKVKDIPTLTKKTLTFLKPKVVKSEDDEAKELLIKKTMELTDADGNKKTKLQTEYLSYAKFSIELNEISDKDLSVDIYFIEPYIIEIIFENNYFSIKDLYFDIYLEKNGFKDVQKSYELALGKKYLTLRGKTELTVDEKNVYDNMNSCFITS